MSLGVKFTLSASDVINWTSKLKELDEAHKLEWEKSERKDLKYRTEYASYHWTPSWDKNKQLRFPVVIKREWKEYKDLVRKEQTGNLFDYLENREGDWHYYAVVTNIDLFRNSKESVHLLHNKRGNCERFIREEKYGFDLLHFPCLKLRKNYAYGLIAQVAHNILRWLAVMERPDKPHFSKKLRRRFIYIPGRLVRHARTLTLKIPKRFYEEVQRMKQALQLEPCSANNTG